MSSTSLFAELVKTQNHRKLIQMMSKEGEQKGKENVEPEASTSSTISVESDHAQISSSHSNRGHDSSSVSTSEKIIHNGTAKVTVINLDESPIMDKSVGDSVESSRTSHSSNQVYDDRYSDNLTDSNDGISKLDRSRTDSSKLDFKKITRLTKLPFPPGINLEEIDSPTSPSTPPDNKPKSHISLTKDLPMPPCKY